MVRRYVDVNVFIYWLCGHPSFGKRAKDWIKRIEKEGNFVTSALTIYETLVIAAGLTERSLKDKELVRTVVNSLTGLRGLKIEPLVEEDFTEAVKLMNDFGLDLEDSLHLAVALRKNAEEIVSNDGDFDKTNLKRVF